MIVGSGLLATAFEPLATALHDVCIYAAGVSNSLCTDTSEFDRDRARLQRTLEQVEPATRFVYFSTCSIDDPWSHDSVYTTHKAQLEELVRARDNCLIVRLPQVAGDTPNPHTLLNYLYNRIARSERFDLWRHANRNIIDVSDAASITFDLVRRDTTGTINVANARSYMLREIVTVFEAMTGRKAIYNLLEKGGSYTIDTSSIADAVQRCGVAFDDGYLLRTLKKYYA
jgi:hypothetical protein